MKKQSRISTVAMVSVWCLVSPVAANALDANLVEGSTLMIVGNGENDWITIEGNGAGAFEVKSGKKANVVVGTYVDVSNLSIIAKDGRNQVIIDEVSVPGSISVTAGAGNDRVDFSGQVSVGGDLVVDLNGGNNTISTKGLASIDVQGSAEFDGNKGNDKMTLSSISTGEHLMIDSAGGNDKIVLGRKNNYLVNVGKRLTITGGRGKNIINVYGAEVESAIRLMTGKDADNYIVQDTSTGSFFAINSGGGKDRIVSKRNTVTDDYNIHCGSGKDTLILKNDSASPRVEQRCDDGF